MGERKEGDREAELEVAIEKIRQAWAQKISDVCDPMGQAEFLPARFRWSG